MLRNYAALALLCVLQAGCVAIPNAKQLAVEPGGKDITIEGAKRPLTPAQDEAALARLARFPGDDEDLQRQVALEGQHAGTPLTAGNRVTLLKDGPETYDAIMRAIVDAKDTIDMESYIFEADSVGKTIADMLIEKSQAGVAVQLIYDSQGSVETPTAFWDRLRAAGVRVLEYNPMNPLKARTGYEPNDRDHRKLLVIDGKRAIMGGINVTETYIYGGAETNSTDRWWVHWHDTDIAIEGPAVTGLQHYFVDNWIAQKGPPLPDRQLFPTVPMAGSNYVRPVPGTPQQGDPEIYIALLSAIRNAQRRIWLTTAFFDPTDETLQALKDAARRGVDVVLQVPGQSDSQATLAAGRSHYTDLLQAGVKLFERPDVFLHGKTATIDSVWSSVGSANLDARSVVWNNELCAIVLGRDFALQMEAMFERDRSVGQPIELQRWASRPLPERIEQWSARMLEGVL